jgi:plasmid rolling circle replication initiator protein Rep
MRNKSESEPHLVESLATETRQGYSDNDFNDRMTRYGKAKAIGVRNHKYITTELKQSNKVRKVALNLRECANYLVFHHYFTKNEYKLAYASLCKQSILCPLCAIRRGAKHVMKYLAVYEHLMAENARLVPYMVTLTVKDGSDLNERFNHLQNSVRTYNKHRHLKHYSSENKKASSAVWSYEVKRGSGSGLWHPHVHGIWLCDEKPDQDKLSSEWLKITGDSFIVDVRPINLQDPITGFLEVFKYAVKFSDQPPKDTWHCYEKLSGRRLIGSFGGFRGVKPPEDLSDELDEDEAPYVEMIMNYFNGKYNQSHTANI